MVEVWERRGGGVCGDFVLCWLEDRLELRGVSMAKLTEDFRLLRLSSS